MLDRHLIHSLTQIFSLLFSEINIVDASSVQAGHRVTAKAVTVHDALRFSALYMEIYIYLYVQKGSILLKEIFNHIFYTTHYGLLREICSTD